MNTTTILGTNEAAAILGVKPVTLRAWRMKGTGPKYVKIAERSFYDPADVEAYAKLRNA